MKIYFASLSRHANSIEDYIRVQKRDKEIEEQRKR